MFEQMKKRKAGFSESVKYIANYLIMSMKEDSGNIFGISGSMDFKEDKLMICENIVSSINKKGMKSKLINVDKEENNIGVDDLKNILNREKIGLDLIIVNIPAISIFADGVEYAKLCDKLILTERYMYSTYRAYEDTIIKLKTHRIKIGGVVTYGY